MERVAHLSRPRTAQQVSEVNSNFSASAVLVKTEPSGAPEADVRPTPSFLARTEKKAIATKRFVPPGDGRFFDGHH